jgi:RND family efflux transporter, MFP subunit
MKKKMLLLLIIAALGAGIYYYHQGKNGRPKAGLTLYGNVDIRELNLGFRVAGRLELMHLEEGDRVSPGQVLAGLDQAPFKDDLAVRAAQVRETEAGLANAEKTYRRRASLVKNGSVAVSDYDEALAQRDELKARLDTARAQLVVSETSLKDSMLISPSAGTVLTRVREPGAIVGAGDVVYTVSLDKPVWVRTYVDEPSLGRIHPGQRVLVKTDSGGRYEGQIGFISPRAEFTPKTVETAALRTDLVYRLRVIVVAPDQGLRQGMPVTIDIPEAQRPPVDPPDPEAGP